MIAIVSIVFVWYMTRYSYGISDNEPVPLHTDEDKVLTTYFQNYVNPVFDFNSNDTSIAAKYLQRVHKVEVDPKLIVIGTNLNEQYFARAHSHLSLSYQKNKDCLFDLRTDIGKNIEFAIIHNPKIRTELQKVNGTDLNELNSIMSSELDISGKEYLQEVLTNRWNSILELSDSNVINNSGSYLYLRNNSSATGLPINIMGDKIIGLSTSKGIRLNLLCNNYEFEALITRWKTSLATKS